MLTRLTWSEIPRQRFSAAASAVLRGSLCYLEPAFRKAQLFYCHDRLRSSTSSAFLRATDSRPPSRRGFFSQPVADFRILAHMFLSHSRLRNRLRRATTLEPLRRARVFPIRSQAFRSGGDCAACKHVGCCLDHVAAR